MAKKSQALALPDNVFAMLAAEDKRKGFPPGTMQSLLMQETGGQAKYINDPTTYHYAPNAEGKRIAGHTGKISTAQGPFGILESTARDPGYGVKPMGDRTSLAEHIRFAGDYLNARGLAKYGEGEKYAAQIMARRDGKKPVATAVVEPVVQMAQAPVVVAPEATPVAEVASPMEPVQVAQAAPTPVAQAPVAPEVAPTEVVAQAAPPVGAPAFAPYQNPDFMAALGNILQRSKPNFQSFGGFGNPRALG